MSWVYQNIAYFYAMTKAKAREEEERKKEALAKAEQNPQEE